MTRVAVHQPNYFPWIGYFHKLAAADIFVLLDNVEFQRGNASSVTNRTTIKVSQGIQKMTVPVLRAGSSPLVQDVLIDQRQPLEEEASRDADGGLWKGPRIRRGVPDGGRDDRGGRRVARRT